MEQKQLPMGPMLIPRSRLLDADIVRNLDTAYEAVDRSYTRRMPKEPIDVFGANLVNPNTGRSAAKSTVSVWKNDQIPASVDLILAWERACRVPAITQWLAHQHGYQLVERERTEDEKMRAENAAMKAELARLRGDEYSEVA